MSLLTATDPWVNMLRNGVVLWRNVSFYNGDPVLDDVRFEPTDRGSFLGRIKLVGNPGCWEPCVQSNSYISSTGSVTYNKGIAVFITEYPPTTWTHLVICGVSTAFTLPGKHGSGGCVFAKVANPCDLTKYLEFRKTLFAIQQRSPQVEIDEAARISSQVSVTKKRENRLIVQQAWIPNACFSYKIIGGTVSHPQSKEEKND